ncbi:hypothetical protein BCR33DRAFT_764580 [Rhizoclosmatium globosum]|uniref:Uncharacterized protein n=1 Tax=Rhizoclosmatium globosum TaxID=329046 RepID=A0A1Y2CIP9_9FUNG|nr:hypothetical protein BCR33DRAFT_764580 [Rhizoclosmatium globosum]|eukprot:ORY46899.1 hypothetical protein BCR33DRAFT_764580 [Rhizoclosmatium globosum]
MDGMWLYGMAVTANPIYGFKKPISLNPNYHKFSPKPPKMQVTAIFASLFAATAFAANGQLEGDACLPGVPEPTCANSNLYCLNQKTCADPGVNVACPAGARCCASNLLCSGVTATTNGTCQYVKNVVGVLVEVESRSLQTVAAPGAAGTCQIVKNSVGGKCGGGVAFAPQCEDGLVCAPPAVAGPGVPGTCQRAYSTTVAPQTAIYSGASSAMAAVSVAVAAAFVF